MNLIWAVTCAMTEDVSLWIAQKVKNIENMKIDMQTFSTLVIFEEYVRNILLDLKFSQDEQTKLLKKILAKLKEEENK